MKFVADLHIHSRYSRACSPQLTLSGIDETCRVKGVDIIATADFTYPAWFTALKSELTEVEQSGLYVLKTAKDDKIKFLLSTEVALIYKAGGKARRIHLVIHAPNLEAVTELNNQLGARFNIKSDGRPILGISAPDLIKLCLKINPEFLIYPAHIWTPWFSVFGSKSGFNKFEECFEEQTENIFAYETGLSSDPAMNWRVSALDNLTLLSNSDAHSPMNIAREANIFELETISYRAVYNLIRNRRKDKNSTIEFYPEEGMYHYDGHRACGFSCAPSETKKLNGRCPKCGRPLTIGVDYRVEELADRPLGFKPENASDYVKLVGLDKIIAESLGINARNGKTVQAEYKKMIAELGNELNILTKVDLALIENSGGPRVAEGVRRVRLSELFVEPGFDGQYGKVEIFGATEKRPQSSLI